MGTERIFADTGRDGMEVLWGWIGTEMKSVGGHVSVLRRHHPDARSPLTAAMHKQSVELHMLQSRLMIILISILLIRTGGRTTQTSTAKATQY